MRLSTSSLAGTARTLVAVGTSSELFMFCTMRAATPRSGTVVLPSAGRRRRRSAGLRRRGLRRPRPASRRTASRRGVARGRLRGGRCRRSRWASPPGGRRGRRPATVDRLLAVAAASRARGGGVVRRGGRARPRPVVGEEVVPGVVDARRIGQIALVHLVDDPLVGTEIRERIVLRSLLGRHSRVRLFHHRSTARDDLVTWDGNHVRFRLRRQLLPLWTRPRSDSGPYRPSPPSWPFSRAVFGQDGCGAVADPMVGDRTAGGGRWRPGGVSSRQPGHRAGTPSTRATCPGSP